MKSTKAKLIKKVAVSKWNEKKAKDRQAWGSFNRYYRHMKRAYAKGEFEIN